MTSDSTPPLKEFLKKYDKDDNAWWYLDSGHHMNLFDEVVQRMEQAEAAAELWEESAKHWKHNHANQVNQKRILINRLRLAEEKMQAADLQIRDLLMQLREKIPPMLLDGETAHEWRARWEPQYGPELSSWHLATDLDQARREIKRLRALTRKG